MDELIILAIEGRASPAQLGELHRWRMASEEHEGRYREVTALWALSGLRQEIEPNQEVPSSEVILRPMIGPPVHRPKGWRDRGLRQAAALAAVFILSIGIAQFAYVWMGTDEVVTAEFHGSPNGLTTAVLPDGSVARLAPNTMLRATIGSQGRMVEIHGRAFFAVTRDPARPFRVRTPQGEVRVLGTRFEVDARNDELRLLVVDGRVALSAEGSETELEAGEMAKMSLGAAPSVRHVQTPESLLDWMGAWVAFEATPLWKVARELQVRLGIQVEIVDPAVADRAISGWFAREDRHEMLSMICRVAEVRCTRVGDLVRIEDGGFGHGRRKQ